MAEISSRTGRDLGRPAAVCRAQWRAWPVAPAYEVGRAFRGPRAAKSELVTRADAGDAGASRLSPVAASSAAAARNPALALCAAFSSREAGSGDAPEQKREP